MNYFREKVLLKFLLCCIMIIVHHCITIVTFNVESISPQFFNTTERSVLLIIYILDAMTYVSFMTIWCRKNLLFVVDTRN